MGWRPIKEYFERKKDYDFVLVRAIDPFDGSYCIPMVAEFRCANELASGGWYIFGCDTPLEYPVIEFFDMKLLDSGPQFG